MRCLPTCKGTMVPSNFSDSLRLRDRDHKDQRAVDWTIGLPCGLKMMIYHLRPQLAEICEKAMPTIAPGHHQTRSGCRRSDSISSPHEENTECSSAATIWRMVAHLPTKTRFASSFASSTVKRHVMSSCLGKIYIFRLLFPRSLSERLASSSTKRCSFTSGY